MIPKVKSTLNGCHTTNGLSKLDENAIHRYSDRYYGAILGKEVKYFCISPRSNAIMVMEQTMVQRHQPQFLWNAMPLKSTLDGCHMTHRLARRKCNPSLFDGWSGYCNKRLFAIIIFND